MLEKKPLNSQTRDGTERMVFIDSDIGTPEGLEIYIEIRSIYWADSEFNRIERARVDGTDRESVFRNREYTSN